MRRACTLLVIVAALPVQAAAGEPANDARARAVALANEGKWREALAAADRAVAGAPRDADAVFVRAGIRLRLAGSASTLEALATPHWDVDYEGMLGHLRAARDDLTTYLRLDPRSPIRSRVEQTRDRIEARIAAASEASARAAKLGALRIRDEPAGAIVFVDGERRGKTPLLVPDLPAGRHTVVVRTETAEWTGHVHVEGRKKTTVAPALARVPLRIAITSEPAGSAVLVDGAPRGNTPLVVDELAPGEHEVVVRANGHVQHVERVAVDLDRRSAEVHARLVGLATLVVDTEPAGAALALDGKEASVRTPTSLELAPGEHRLRIEHALHRPVERSVRLAARQTLRLHVLLQLQPDIEERVNLLVATQRNSSLGLATSLGVMSRGDEDAIAMRLEMDGHWYRKPSVDRARAMASVAKRAPLPSRGTIELALRITGSTLAGVDTQQTTFRATVAPALRWWWRGRLGIGGTAALGWASEQSAFGGLGLTIAASSGVMARAERWSVIADFMPLSNAPAGDIAVRVRGPLFKRLRFVAEAGRTRSQDQRGRYFLLGVDVRMTARS